MADTMTDVERVARALFDASETTIDDWTGMAQAAIACLRSMGWAPLEEAARVAEDAYKRGHRTGDMETAVEPDNIAAAIRSLAPKTE